ncbi:MULTISPECIES: GerAB/ArcD/ProY family transporter [unclassified Paenibacillus]|uniref:GerAB/ArcD/ProY family transporter n=1 Tax=unclassified Paenibacillus TaxID=185978 RepID=UPI0010E77A10|nr:MULTISPECIES: GerAB/ArcD/ProY family transporter [unclassified Paenibacillus]TCM96213.1 spore germination protein KB [Paenibacillus sp. BK033]
MPSKVNTIDTFAMQLVFLLSTSIIFGTPSLVPDSWLTGIFAFFPACLLLVIYSAMLASTDNLGLYPLLEKAWGKATGKVFILIYSTYFLYIAARNVRDMIELIMSTLLRMTPVPFLTTLFVFLVAYCALGGIHAIARFASLILWIVLFMLATVGILLLFSSSIILEQMLPFLSKGLWPVIQSAFTHSIWFPYGESVVFLVFQPQLGGAKGFRKVTLYAFISTCFILSITDLIQICTLGIEMKKYSVFALLDAARLINIANIITRMDALIALIIIFGTLLKCAVFLYAAMEGISYVLKRKPEDFAFPLAILAGAFSILVTRNSAEHVAEGLKYVIYTLHIPLQLLVPLLTLVIVRIRYRKGATT